MKIKVLGCHGGELPRHRTTCFLIDGKLAIDGGAITAALELEDILKIDDIFLTHSHFDHVKDIPLMADLLKSMPYYWVTAQSEYSTDIFQEPGSLKRALPTIA